MSIKVNLTCSFCSKIYKELIVLPCGHTMCEEHLHEQEKIEWVPCRKEFNLCKHVFVPNFVVRNIINDKDFLGISIVNRVIKIEESYSNYDNLFSEYQALRNSFAHFELECHE